jgi:hypothetical protein
MNTLSSDELISLHEAGQRGIERVRKPIWANPMDHLKIDLVPGGIGPWLHLWCPFNKQCNGKDPQSFLGLLGGADYNCKEWLPYTGPLPDSAEYKADVAKYEVKA